MGFQSALIGGIFAEKHWREEAGQIIVGLRRGLGAGTRPPKCNPQPDRCDAASQGPCTTGCRLLLRPRTSEDFGLTWKSYAFDLVYDTAYEGRLYEGKVKTEDSRARIPIPRRIRPYIESWRQVCPDTSPDALMFATKGHLQNIGKMVPFRAQNFFKWKVWPIADKLGIDRKLCTFQVLRRTLGTDLQTHGTMKDAQAILRHNQIKTTAEIYMKHIPESVRKAIDSRTDSVFAKRSKAHSKKSSGVLLGFARDSKGREH